MSGGLAVCAFVITGFGLLILWGRTPPGKRTLAQLFGDPTPPKPAPLATRAKRKPAPKAATSPAKPRAPGSSRSSSTPASSPKKKPAPRAK